MRVFRGGSHTLFSPASGLQDLTQVASITGAPAGAEAVKPYLQHPDEGQKITCTMADHLGRMVTEVAIELDIPQKCLGETTWKRPELSHGRGRVK